MQLFIDEYLYKELFVIVRGNEQEEVKTVGLAKGFDNLLKYVTKHNADGQFINEDLKVYHGTLIPTKFIHSKINNLTELFLLTVDTFPAIEKDNNPDEENEDDEYVSIKGNFQEIKPFMSLIDVTKFISKVFTENHCDIKDLFLFVGYEMTLANFQNWDEAVDEAELVSGISIGDQTKTIIELFDQVEIAMYQDFAVGMGNNQRYSKVASLFGNNFIMGC